MLSRTFDEQLEKSKTSFWDAKESKFENEPKQMYSLQIWGIFLWHSVVEEGVATDHPQIEKSSTRPFKEVLMK